MRRNLFLILLLSFSFIPLTGWAQFVKITGTLVDRETGEPMIAATVRATISGGGEETFGISNEKGVFSLEVQRPGTYQMEFSYVGYKKLLKEFNCRPGSNNLGKIRMTESAVELKDTQIIGKNMRVKQHADTTVYNADGYKVMAGATGEDLIAKMPGMKISDGKIEAQGEEVKKVLVDGKPFFENDPQLALKTLPAEVIQSVAIFDKKSEQAEFTGFDDGNSVKALDVRTRSFRRNGVFGKLYGQYGTDNRYNFGGNVNVFNGDRRFTFLGLFNNVNQQNFSIDDILGSMSGGKGPRGGAGGPGMPPPGSGGGGMQNMISSQSGIARANAVGLNYSDILSDKVEVNGSYFFNMTRTVLADSLNRNYFDTLGGVRNYDELSQSLTHNYAHRANMRLTYKPTENDEILFMPNVSFQKNNSETETNSQMLVGAEAQNKSQTLMDTKANGYNLNGELLWRHRFAKDGRTLSTMFRGNSSKNDSQSNQQITLNEVESAQVVDNKTSGYGAGANLMYTEPISNNQQLSGSYNVNFSNTRTDKQTDEYEGDVYTPDPYLSSNYSSDYLTQAIGIGYRLNNKKIRLMTNLNFQRADLKGEQVYPYDTDLSYKTSKSFNSLLPMVMFDFMPEQNQSLRLMYRSNSSSPSVTQLQQTIDNSNPLQLYQGNPELDQIVDHSFSVRYITSNIEKATNWMAYLNFTKKFDYIGSDVTIAATDQVIDGITLIKGGQITKPVNLDGYFTLSSNITYGFPIDLLMSNLNISIGANYNQTPGIQNGISLKTRSLSLLPGATLTSNISQNIDFTLDYKADFNKVKNNLRPDNNYDYLTHTGMAKVSWVIWNGFIVENVLNWKCYTGSAMDKQEQFWLWNASIGKKFLKNNQAELKLSGYDLLKQNRAFSRTIADAYVQTSYTNVLSRYFMLTFTYNLQNYKKKA